MNSRKEFVASSLGVGAVVVGLCLMAVSLYAASAGWAAHP
jgi:hypothetical protein